MADFKSADSYGARFGGSFDLTDEDGQRLQIDDEVMVVTIARVKEVALRETRTGDTRIVYVLKPDEARVVAPQMVLQLARNLDFSIAEDSVDTGGMSVNPDTVSSSVTMVGGGSIDWDSAKPAFPSTDDPDFADKLHEYLSQEEKDVLAKELVAAYEHGVDETDQYVVTAQREITWQEEEAALARAGAADQVDAWQDPRVPTDGSPVVLDHFHVAEIADEQPVNEVRPQNQPPGRPKKDDVLANFLNEGA